MWLHTCVFFLCLSGFSLWVFGYCYCLPHSVWKLSRGVSMIVNGCLSLCLQLTIESLNQVCKGLKDIQGQLRMLRTIIETTCWFLPSEHEVTVVRKKTQSWEGSFDRLGWKGKTKMIDKDQWTDRKIETLSTEARASTLVNCVVFKFTLYQQNVGLCNLWKKENYDGKKGRRWNANDGNLYWVYSHFSWLSPVLQWPTATEGIVICHH